VVLGLEARLGDVHVPDHVCMALFVMLLCAAVFIPMRRSFSLENPSKFQQLLELLVQGLRGLLEDIIGHGAGRRYLPIIGSFAVFIFLSNFSGQFFFLQPPTGNPNTTFALSLSAFAYYHFAGLRAHGLSYFKQFLGPVPALFPLFIPLEIISHLARAVSLGLRLFGNIFGEHLAAGVFFALVPFVVPFPLMALGIFGSLLQTFIFVMLTTVYIAGAEASEH
jgi:F-type H+-transporting ATPase subunit a